MCWSKWRNIKEKSVCNDWAIYKIRMQIDNNAVPIPRFLEIDKEGLLCIGKTKNFETRRKQFIRGWETGQGHAGSNLLFLLNRHTNIKRKFKDYTCQYSYKIIKRNRNLDNLESQKIKDYVKIYGEVPPLNSVIPYRYNQW